MIVKLLILLTACFQSVQAKPYKKIPAPLIDSHRIRTSSLEPFILKGSGFISSYPQAHRVKLVKDDKSYKVKVLQSSHDNLEILIPKNLDYGDYDLIVHLQTNLFKSNKTKLPKLIQLRPAAPPAPELRYQVIHNTDELLDLSNNSILNSHELKFKFQDLNIGPNLLTASYTVNGWESLDSTPSTFYYFPKDAMETSLKLESEVPLKTLALTKNLESSFNVSDITNIEINDLSKHFFLSTPKLPKYLESVIELSPVFIEKLMVKAEEYAVLRNRSAEDFLLENCRLNDSIRARYSFKPEDKILAKQSITIQANLGLNDTSPDYLSLECAEEEIDRYSYRYLDAEGFGIKE